MKTEGMRFPFTQEQIDEFWTKVDKTPGQGPEGTCWEWKGYTKNKEGYGGFHVWQIKNSMNTHKFAFLVSHNFQYGDIHRTWMIRHGCNNPKCVNPDHLLLGTPKDNSQDMVEAGNSFKGERNNKSVLSDVEIKQMRDLWVTGEYTITALAKKFKLTGSAVSHIVYNQTRKDPTYDPPDLRHRHFKYTKEVIDDVKERLSRGESVKSIIELTGMSMSHVYNIVHNRMREYR